MKGFDPRDLLRESDDPRRLARALKQLHELLELAEQSAGIGIWDVDLATGMVRGTAKFFRILGLEPSSEPVPIETTRAVRHPEDRDRVVEGFEKALVEGVEIYESEYRILLPDGQVRWIFGRGRTTRDDDGRPVRYSGVDIDITDRKRAEEALRESEERFSKAFHSAAHPMSISTLKEGRYLDVNAASLAASGRRREEVIGRTVGELGFYDDPDRFQTVRDLLGRHGQFTDLETRLHGAAGTRTFLLSGAVIDLRGEPCVLTSAIDITERKRAEEHIKLLMHEVNHRSNNMLALVQAIARLTVSTGDPEQYSRQFSQRISALAASNKLMVSGKWVGVEVTALVKSQLSHFQDLAGKRIVLDGQPMRLEPHAAQAVGMALHELATNAGKHGALSGPHGRVRIDWQVAGVNEERSFRMTWSESDGPPVVPPARTGFGHTVMMKMIESSLGGTTQLDFAPGGIHWAFTCPASKALTPDEHMSGPGC